MCERNPLAAQAVDQQGTARTTPQQKTAGTKRDEYSANVKFQMVPRSIENRL